QTAVFVVLLFLFGLYSPDVIFWGPPKRYYFFANSTAIIEIQLLVERNYNTTKSFFAIIKA
ncbi:MAG: hypothetical protein ACI4QN_02965, partial [Candidatus Coproplasma sp.]